MLRNLGRALLSVFSSVSVEIAQRDLDDYIHELTINYRKKIFSSTSACCNVRPRAQILMILPASFADNPFTYVHEVAFEMI
jgi:hypothetical protein